MLKKYLASMAVIATASLMGASLTCTAAHASPPSPQPSTSSLSDPHTEKADPSVGVDVTAPASTQDHHMGSQIARVEKWGDHDPLTSDIQDGSDHTLSRFPHLMAAPQSKTLVATSGGPSMVPGIDISHYDVGMSLASQYRQGRRFAWVKATEGHSFRDRSFNRLYTATENAGMVRGGYHFARPDSSSGRDQADFFSAHGGGWSTDNGSFKTLPGAVDMEWNPGRGGACYGMSKRAMASWVYQFITEYKKKWDIYPIIYTSRGWWNQCVGSYGSASASRAPLWMARYGSTTGSVPAGWKTWLVWQNSETGFDHDVFHGNMAGLKGFAAGYNNGRARPAPGPKPQPKPHPPTPPKPSPACGASRTINGYHIGGGIGCAYTQYSSRLGQPRTPMVRRRGIYYQVFDRGAITYARGIGGQAVWGHAWYHWRHDLGVAHGIDMLGVARNSGDGTEPHPILFQRGMIVFRPSHHNGSYDMGGGFYVRYAKTPSAFGLPKSSAVPGRGNSGVRKEVWFDRGIITWDGSRNFGVSGAIYRAWTRDGSEIGHYGRPVTEMYRSSDGAYRQLFAKGYALVYKNGVTRAIHMR